MWPEGTRRDPAPLQEDKRTWDPSLFRAEGQRSQREHPRDGASWGRGGVAVLPVGLPSPACWFCVCILPLLVPCNRHIGNDGGVAEPSALWSLCDAAP